MHHTLAWSVLLGTTANTDITPVNDGIIQQQNAHFILPYDMRLLWAWAASTTLGRVRLNSPKLRQFSPVYLRPIDRAILPPNDPNYEPWHENPLTLAGQEEIIVEATSLVAMGTERFTMVVGVSRETPAPVVGDTYNLRFTSTTAAVANAWSLLAVTFEQQLPAGQYDVVGAELQSTNGQAFRFTFDDQYYRPGGLMITGLGNRSPWRQHNGGWGKWGTFRTVSLPRVEVLCNAADAAFEGYLEVVRRGI